MNRFLPVLALSIGLLQSTPLTADSFRITFGGADREVSDWSGDIAAQGGTVEIVASYHFALDESFEGTSWSCGNQWDGKLQMEPRDAAAFPDTRWKGLVVNVEGSERTVVEIETRQGNTRFRPEQVRFQERLKLLAGRIRVERVPEMRSVSGEQGDDDYPALAIGPDGRKWLAWISFRDGADIIEMRSSTDGIEWIPIEQVTPTPGDYYQVALVSTRPNQVSVVFSAIVDGTVNLYARNYEDGNWSAVSKLTHGTGPDTFPRLAAAPNENVFLVWQSGSAGNTDISMLTRRGQEWSDPVAITRHPASDWEPALAVNSRGEAAILWDSYRHGNYDIFLRRWAAGKLGPVERLTSSPDFEAHVSAVYDHRDRLWFAYDNGGPNWGKDHYGINGIQRGESGLYFHRQAQVRVLDRGRISEPKLPLDHRLPSGAITGSWMALGLDSARETFTEYPRLAVDGKGRIWAVVRTRALGRANPPAVAERSIFPYWNYHVMMFDGHAWMPPVWVPFSDGRIEQRPGTAIDKDGNLWIASQTDGKSYPDDDPRFLQYDLYAGKIALDDVPGGAVEDEYLVGSKQHAAPESVDDTEPAVSTPLWKKYEMEVVGEKYTVTWGDLHRHTDLSFDGYSDGSLYDSYRYAIDAARMDFLGPSEHLLVHPADTPYLWRMIDKAIDVYKLPRTFYPLLNYERTVAYPDGHRNIVSRSRGFQPIRMRPGPRDIGVAEDDMVALWEQLLGGGRPQAISIPHTTATQMGTDWRYNNEKVERLVEMYQGNRDSYEYLGAPRGATADKIVVGGYITSGEIHPKGFVWNALAKGYKMGFIASSDHRSTHMSYAAVYTPERDYGEIWNSLYDRRTYAATDNIIVDFQSGGHAMGEEFATDRPPRLDVRVIGTGPIARIDIIKDNTFVYTAHPDVEEISFSYTDRSIEPGTHYYYVRVIQADDNMAWASPIWVRFGEPSR